MATEQILLRFILTFSASLIYGIERQMVHKPVSFGTFIFVSNGACALAMIALQLQPESPAPLLGAIVSSIGFLGAGALIKTTDKIYGFTTAASIWVFAILGLLLGIGYFLPAGIIYGVIWIVNFIDIYFQKMSIGTYQKKIRITSQIVWNKLDLQEVLDAKRFKMIHSLADKENENYNYEMLVVGDKKLMDKLFSRLLEHPQIKSFSIE